MTCAPTIEENGVLSKWTKLPNVVPAVREYTLFQGIILTCPGPLRLVYNFPLRTAGEKYRREA